ncbi:MAG: methylated-DNA--[protein]-cysteine S-methyltransferase [Chloroflexi bacterium]|nr:methylated-DNA--[protein]-cysteine S-methyltransferase [Chloroflexota bacterium]
MTTLTLTYAPAPPGDLVLALYDGVLVGLEFADCADRLWPWLRRRFGEYTTRPASGPGDATERLQAYFAGDLRATDRIVIDAGGTPFQRVVWHALRAIPPGERWSYGQLATRIGRPLAARAVGAANSRNPIAIIIPCHRLVGAHGNLTGYGGGLARKAWLLRHEKGE